MSAFATISTFVLFFFFGQYFYVLIPLDAYPLSELLNYNAVQLLRRLHPMAPPPNAPRPPPSHPVPGRNLGSEVAQLENLVRKLSEQVDRMRTANEGNSSGVSDTQWWIIVALLLLILAVNAIVLGLYWHRKGESAMLTISSGRRLWTQRGPLLF